MHDVAAAGELGTEVTRRVDLLARLLRMSASTAETLSSWAGFPLRREPRVADREHHLDEDQALLLDMRPGSRVTFRDGYLCAPTARGVLLRAAAVTALVREAALGLDLHSRAALRAGQVPLSQILRGAHRAVHFVQRLPGDPVDGQPALWVRSTWVSAGIPVALVNERVDWRLIQHRCPGELTLTLRPATTAALAWRAP